MVSEVVGTLPVGSHLGSKRKQQLLDGCNILVALLAMHSSGHPKVPVDDQGTQPVLPLLAQLPIFLPPLAQGDNIFATSVGRAPPCSLSQGSTAARSQASPLGTSLRNCVFE